jgi:hypothetical protein
MTIDKDRLSKLMMMTTSENDGEALVALRMANKLLQRATVNWEQLLTGGGPTAKRGDKPSYKQSREEYRAQTYNTRYGAGPRKFRDEFQSDEFHFTRKPRPQPNVHSGERIRDPEIDAMLRELATRTHTLQFMLWLADVTNQWKRKGWLNVRQYEGLRNSLRHSKRWSPKPPE